MSISCSELLLRRILQGGDVSSLVLVVSGVCSGFKGRSQEIRDFRSFKSSGFTIRRSRLAVPVPGLSFFKSSWFMVRGFKSQSSELRPFVFFPATD